MKEYIEREAALDIVTEWCPDDDGSVGKTGDLRDMLDELEAIPAADVVEVVRCGNCKRRDKITGWCEDVQDYISNTNWFCAGGEKMDGGADE